MVTVFKAKGVGRMKLENANPTTVLVVEDEPTVRALAESIIEALGHMILSAANAREAIALLEQDEPIDILFTDINLPDGPDRDRWASTSPESCRALPEPARDLHNGPRSNRWHD